VRRLVLLAACAGSIWAADAQIDLPVIGHVFDADARGVRAILGIPGSSRMTDVLAFEGLAFRVAWIAPGRSYGLAAGTDGKLYRIDSVGRSATEIEADVPEQVVWSPHGTSAALRYSTGHVRVFRSFESTPKPGLQTVFNGGVAQLAVSDDGGVLLGIGGRENGKTLIAFSEGGARELLSAPGLKDVTFFFDSRDAVVSDDAEGKIYTVRESGELAVLAQVDEASALAVARDNSQVFVASKQWRTVTSIRISDGARIVHDCACAPGVFQRLQADIFRVSDHSDRPMWLFNGSAREAHRFTFVPQPEGSRE
jgi:hypothetical protein